MLCDGIGVSSQAEGRECAQPASSQGRLEGGQSVTYQGRVFHFEVVVSVQ